MRNNHVVFATEITYREDMIHKLDELREYFVSLSHEDEDFYITIHWTNENLLLLNVDFYGTK